MSSTKPRIGLIGVGLMGHGIGKNLVEKGFPLTILGHRNRAPVEDLVARGAVEAFAARIALVPSEILRIKNELNELISQHTGQPLERIERDTDRDYYMAPEEAIKYGLIDGVIDAAPEVVLPKAGAAHR